jgi:ABC-type Zn uptake system ZnuABC Zn-binding protein ZnuA
MRLFIPLIAVLCVLIAACTQDAPPARTSAPSPTPAPAVDHSASPFKIVVSLPIFADMAREIVGDQAQITTLVPPGADPHTYVPTDDLAQAVKEAQIIFYNGNGLEPPAQQFIEAHETRPLLTINFTHNIPSPGSQPGSFIYAEQVGDNPHLFLDPQLATIYPETVAGSMVIKDGQNAAYYNARFQAYKQKLDALDTEISRKLGNIPAQNRGLLVTYHNSLIWFAKHYGLGVAGTVVDNGADGLAQVLTSQHPPAVFTETGYDTAVLKQLAQTAGVPVCHLETDSIAEAGTTYIQMMERNADEIARCLGQP